MLQTPTVGVSRPRPTFRSSLKRFAMGDSPPGLDLERVLPWFRDQVEPVDSLTGSVIGHGRSNITYRLASDGESWVLRRPPLSHVQATAHDMGREFRILSALAPTGFPAPKPIALGQDPAVNDAPFYIMEYVDGLIPVDPNEVKRRFDEGQRRKIGEELVDVHVRLHAFVPSEIGLDGFPSWEEAAMRYQEKSGRDLSGLDFYAVLAHFKLGVILENMHRRFLVGGTVGPGFEMIGQYAQLPGQRGLTIADTSEINELRG